MISVYDDLPDDPEQAFIVLEEHFRDRLDRQLQNANEQDNTSVFYTEYIGRVLAAIEELDLSAAFRQVVPRIEEVDYSTYLNFNKDVEHYKTSLRIRHARRAKGFSIKFDEATKQKILHHLTQIKEIIPKLEISEGKREDLIGKVLELEKELARDRTRLEVAGDFLIATTSIIGEAAEQLEPLRRWVDSIAGLFWGARKDQQKRLPAPTEQKRLEPPKVEPTARKPNSEMNDDIPF